MQRERWKQLACANAEVIRREIKQLAVLLEGTKPLSFIDFWTRAKYITSMFKTFKPLENGEREDLWAEFHGFCETCRALQEGQSVKFREASSKLRERITAMVRDAEEGMAKANDLDALSTIDKTLKEALSIMKSRFTKDENGAEGEEISAPRQTTTLTKKDREACWSLWLPAREAANSKRKSLLEHALENLKTEANGLLDASSTESPLKVQEDIKAAQKRLKEFPLRPAERDEVRGILRGAWKNASEAIDRLRTERKQQHEEWVERMKEHLHRWETALLRNKWEAGELESSDPINGRKKERVKSLEALNRELEEKIGSVRAKLGREAPEPILELAPEDRPHMPKTEQRKPRQRKDETAERPQGNPNPGLNLGELLLESLKGSRLAPSLPTPGKNGQEAKKQDFPQNE